MKKFFEFLGTTSWLVFQFTLAVGVTVSLLSIVPIIVLGILGLAGFVVAAWTTMMAMLSSPYLGLALGIVMFLIVGIVTLLAMVLSVLILILAVSLIALPTSLLAQNALRQNRIKSWLVHLSAYSISGAFVGGFLGTLPSFLIWTSLKDDMQHPELAVLGMMLFSIFGAMFSVNMCGVIVSATNKVREFFVLRRKPMLAVITQNPI